MVISRVIIGITPFKVHRTLLLTYLLSPLPLQVCLGSELRGSGLPFPFMGRFFRFKALGFRVAGAWGLGFRVQRLGLGFRV